MSPREPPVDVLHSFIYIISNSPSKHEKERDEKICVCVSVCVSILRYNLQRQLNILKGGNFINEIDEMFQVLQP